MSDTISRFQPPQCQDNIFILSQVTRSVLLFLQQQVIFMVMFEILNIISHLVGSIGSFGKKPY